MRVCIQNLTALQPRVGPVWLWQLEQRAASGSATRRSDPTRPVRTRGAAIGQLGQLHCGHTAGKRCLGSTRRRIALVVRTRVAALPQIDEHQCFDTTSSIYEWPASLACATRISATAMDYVRRRIVAVWSKRPDPGTDTHIQVVLQFKTWEITKLEGKENLTWSGVLELYWTDARLDGCPRSHSLPENIWRPRMTGSVGFSLGDAEKCEATYI